MATNDPPSSAAEPTLPSRFVVSRGTLRWDRLMNRVIVVVGLGIILAVFGIFAFIASVVGPLFKSASLKALSTVALSSSSTPPQAFGIDEWSELPFSYDGGDRVDFHPVDGSQPLSVSVPLPAGTSITSHRVNRTGNRIVIGTQTGEVAAIAIAYAPEYNEGQRTISGSAKLTSWQSLSLDPAAEEKTVVADHSDAGHQQIYAALLEAPNGTRRLSTMVLKQPQGLMGGGETRVDSRDDLTAMLDGERPVDLLVPGTADSVIVLTESNEWFYLFREAGRWELRQRQRPFPEPTATVTQMHLLFGDVSLVFCDETGRIRLFSLHVPEGSPLRSFGLTQEMSPLNGPITWFQSSKRNKTFVVGNADSFALCYATTGTVRTTVNTPFQSVAAVFDAKAEHLGVMDQQGGLHLYQVNDPHPEAGLTAFFGKVWYEGYSAPRWEWQSTGGTDDFEPKLSLVPLIVGSFKGTLYALLFAIPIALFAAVYTSQFLSAKIKNVVKPAMEVMASLPSVVLGFIAALWLAPAIESKVPSVLLMLLSVPVAAMLACLIWFCIPLASRNRLPHSPEFWLLLPLTVALGLVGWSLGPSLEQWLFVTPQMDGSTIADFRLWWPHFTGLPFDQRNCLVVGFIMGFAVIPVIFTIAEDSISNVPPSLSSAAEALGASRWQVVRTVVLPIASAGIFSAVMIGLGRAVGETMIVVMATGNTPIMDEAGRLLLGDAALGGGHFPLADQWNPFNGMRTLSANIAVELPEAAQGSTHYRTLFLGALVLFMLTFVLNTAAELLRLRLRKKFRVT